MSKPTKTAKTAKTKLCDLGKHLESLRQERKMRKVDVYRGICEREDYYRYLNGTHRPRWRTLEKLLDKMGITEKSKFYKYYTTQQDPQFVDIKHELNLLLNKKTPDNYQNAESIVKMLDANRAFKADKSNHQLLLRAKARLAQYNGNYTAMYNYAHVGIKMTRPSFDENKISEYTLFHDEILLLDLMAAAVASPEMESMLDRAINILRQLEINMSREKGCNKEFISTYLRVLYNLTKYLGMSKSYKKAIPLCDKGIELCRIHNQWLNYPRFLINKGIDLLELNRKKEGMIYIEKAHAYLRSSERFAELATIEEFLEKTYGITPDEINSYSSSA